MFFYFVGGQVNVSQFTTDFNEGFSGGLVNGSSFEVLT